MGQKTVLGVEPEQEKEKKKLDLSVAQVAGSSLATVAAAVLASGMGLYGTIIGAGIVSVVATAGGPVIQHFFRRTGDQLRETARPKARQVPVDGPGSAPAGRAPDGTMMLGTVPAGGPPTDEEFSEGTVHGTRMRGWKRTAVASGAAFAIALGGLGTYEAVAGTAVSAGGGTIFTGGVGKARDYKPDTSKEQQGTGTGTGTGEKGGKTPDTGSSPTPSHSNGGQSPKPKPDPDTSPSADPSSSPSPTPPKPDPSPSTTPSKSPTPSSGRATPGGAGTSGTGAASAPTP
ncbi:hypothetical protein OHA37_09420 [Streptomyces sp. NBC_00335]|uniref:hypothetical protein n=1 Tax=unclassified Streptomyces TaxID=2593676 RepID=UPI00224D4E41|nr:MULTISPECIES: hypothetical protein [unclassified Streptomyces]MCX5404103.1 hypothetical protein [Streptomyces sp. NBC_00086]